MISSTTPDAPHNSPRRAFVIAALFSALLLLLTVSLPLHALRSSALLAEVGELRSRVAKLRAALGALSCECKGIGPSGGFCLAPPKDGARYNTTQHKGGGVGGNAILSLGLAAAVGELTNNFGVHNFGAGMGQYDLFWDSARAAGQPAPARSVACDGAENIEAVVPLDSQGQPRVRFCDLTEPMNLPAEDWVVSLEVGEHIPSAFEGVFVGNLQRHAKRGVVVSWAVPGQGGHHHVNNHDAAQVLALFPEDEWNYDAALAQQLRQKGAPGAPWFANTVYVFWRKGMGF
jgi:hypothetical protein